MWKSALKSESYVKTVTAYSKLEQFYLSFF